MTVTDSDNQGCMDTVLLLQRLEAIVGADGCLRDEALMAQYVLDQRQAFQGRALAVVRPRDTAQVSAVVRECARAGVGVVPQGGNTGLCGGSVPDDSASQVVLSLSRMNRVREVDARNFTMTVEAGCVLADVQAVARERDLLFPLSLAAEGSCQIGGNLSTNAGGTAVLRYGNARDLVLGLEVVLADGQVWDGLRHLRKDNTGYKLSQLFVGAEGTLGIITAAVIKLFPRPQEMHTSLIAVRDPDAAVTLLERLRACSGDAVSAFEYMNRSSLKLALDWIDGNRDPFDGPHEHYVLVELSAGSHVGQLRDVLESVLAEALETGDVHDAVIAQNHVQAQAMWKLRESIPGAQKRAGASIKHDISVPVSKVPELLVRGGALMREEIPDVLVVAFGHIGDGNIHFNANQDPDLDVQDIFCARDAVHRRMYELVSELGGSFSAEHGIGKLKISLMEQYRPAVELEMMRKIKSALDPAGLLNPGKLL